MKDLTEKHIVFRWIGHSGSYLNAVPSRDLTAEDLVELEDREGIDSADIELSGLYELVSMSEIASFCGAETEEGGRCRRPVQRWGLRCWQHQEVLDGTEGVS